MKLIIGFFAKEHLFGNLLTFLLIVFGLYTVSNIRRDIFPEVNFNYTIITTHLVGASPEQTENLVVNVIEPRLREVDGIKLIRSTALENRGIVVAQLDPDEDPDETNADIQQLIDRLDELPEEAEKPIITKVETGKRPILEVNVSGELPLYNCERSPKISMMNSAS